MKKAIYSCLTAILFVSLFTSCDDTATDAKIEDASLDYISTLSVSIYSPTLEVENDPLCIDSMLSTTQIVDTIGFDISNGASGMRLFVKGLDNLCFEIPFLDANGNVRTIFSDGIYASLYNRLRTAAEGGKVDMALFRQFQENIRVIRDTINFGSFYTSPMTYEEYGASIITWDYEQNSNYVQFHAEEPVYYNRGSNIYTALRPLQHIIQQWAADGKLTADDIKDLEDLRAQQSGSSAAWGWGTVKYANYNLAFDLHIEPEYTRGDAALAGSEVGDGMLDKLSLALFGKDAQGKPKHPAWLVIKFSGNAITSSQWKPVV